MRLTAVTSALAVAFGPYPHSRVFKTNDHIVRGVYINGWGEWKRCRSTHDSFELNALWQAVIELWSISHIYEKPPGWAVPDLNINLAERAKITCGFMVLFPFLDRHPQPRHGTVFRLYDGSEPFTAQFSNRRQATDWSENCRHSEPCWGDIFSWC